MEIAVNTRLLIKDKLEGIGWFSYETLKRITQKHPEHHFTFLFDRNYDESFLFSHNITPIILSPQARHPILFYWWFEHSVAGTLKSLKPDLFLSPDGYLSLSSPTPSLPVMHDLNFKHYPEDLPFLVRKYYNHYFPKFAQKATRIATVSEYSKKDIVSSYNISAETIDVVYNGVNEFYGPISDEEKKQTLNKYAKGEDYFVFVGSLHPRKNIKRLLLAFDAFKKTSGGKQKLLLVGEKYWWTNEIEQTYDSLQNKSDVILTGRLTVNELKNVLASSLALTYVPYFEGFGIPILEAMKCGTPVITSNVTSMPEVSKNAAILTDPFSIDSIKEAMQAIAKNEVFRKDLVEKGFARSNEFSWNKTADLLWQSIERTIAQSKYKDA